jgi:mannose/fructose/N-acetylgalactosamine-specific phosphotransferase system component IIB
MTDTQSPNDEDRPNPEILSEDIHNHPLADQLMDLAAEKQIDLSDISSVAKVISNIDDADEADVRSLLLFSLILERIINHEELLSSEEMTQETSPPDLDLPL